MIPGRLRKRVQILQANPVRQQFGGEKVNWNQATVLATVWGGFAPQVPMSSQAEHAQQQVAVRYALVTLRYLPSVTITPRNALRMNGRLFAVQQVINVDERNRELTVAVKELD